MRSGTAARGSSPPRKRRQPKARRKTPAAQRGHGCRLPDFIAPQLCETRRATARGRRAGSTRSSSTAIASRCACDAGTVTLRTRKGLDWTAKYPAIARSAGRCRMRSSMARSAPSMTTVLRISPPSRQRFPKSKTDAPRLLRVRSAVRGQRGPAGAAPDGAQGAPGEAACRRRRGSAPSLRRAFRDAAARPSSARPAGCRWKASSPSSGDAPYVSGRTETWAKSKCRAGHEVVIGGYATTNGKFRSLLVGVNRGDHFVYVGRVGTGYGVESGRA